MYVKTAMQKKKKKNVLHVYRKNLSLKVGMKHNLGGRSSIHTVAIM